MLPSCGLNDNQEGLLVAAEKLPSGREPSLCWVLGVSVPLRDACTGVPARLWLLPGDSGPPWSTLRWCRQMWQEEAWQQCGLPRSPAPGRGWARHRSVPADRSGWSGRWMERTALGVTRVRSKRTASSISCPRQSGLPLENNGATAQPEAWLSWLSRPFPAAPPPLTPALLSVAFSSTGPHPSGMTCPVRNCRRPSEIRALVFTASPLKYNFQLRQTL